MRSIALILIISQVKGQMSKNNLTKELCSSMKLYESEAVEDTLIPQSTNSVSHKKKTQNTQACCQKPPVEQSWALWLPPSESRICCTTFTHNPRAILTFQCLKSLQRFPPPLQCFHHRDRLDLRFLSYFDAFHVLKTETWHFFTWPPQCTKPWLPTFIWLTDWLHGKSYCNSQV